MSGFDGLRRVFRIGIAGGDVDREIERELAFHFERTVEELVAAGLSEGAARNEAERRFGDARHYRRELRKLDRGRETRVQAANGLRVMRETLGEAARGVSRAPGLALAVVAVMALGLGVNGTMFAMLDRVFLSPPPHVQDASEIRRPVIQRRNERTRELVHQAYLTYPDYRDWDSVEGFAATAAYSPQTMTLGHGDGAERVRASLVTASYFPMLGVRPALGRLFSPDDDAFGAPLVAVLGHEFWRSRFGGDRSVLGREVDIGEGRYTVVGVLPVGFTGVDLRRVDVWLPFHPAGELEEGGREWEDHRGWYWFLALARLAPGVEAEAAAAQATAAHLAGRTGTRFDNHPEARVALEPLALGRSSEASDDVRLGPWLMGVALLVLLIACANVANLFLARGLRRRRETAVRLALGVSRARLSGVLALESLLPALLGGVAALLLAVWGGDLVRAMLLPDLEWHPSLSDPRLLAFVVGASLVAGVLAGLLPAVQAGRPNVLEGLKSGGRGVTRHRPRLRSGLLVAQAALSVVLLVGTGLFVRSLMAARDVDLGFDARPVLMVDLEPEGGYPGGEAMVALYRRALEHVDALAGVEAAALATTVPFRSARGVDIRRPGEDSLPSELGSFYVNAVTPEAFRVLDLRIIRGRGLVPADDSEAAPRVAVVSELMAQRLWPDGDALGECFIIEEQEACTTVVGVVEDSRRFALVEPADGKYYLPLARAPFPWPPTALLLRTGPDLTSMAGPVQRELQAVLPDIRLITVRRFQSYVDPEYRAWRLGASLFGAFGVLALIVAAVGLYSLLAFSVAQRTGEIGVRSALGASRNRIVRQVLRDGLRLACIGVALGLAAAAATGPWVRELLFDVSPYDPAVMAAVALALLAVAATASGIPAWRAARVDPAEALRAE